MTTTTEVEHLKKALAAITSQRKAANRASALAALLGLLVLGGLGFYFYLGYQATRTITEPKNLVAYAGSLAEDRLPEAQSALAQELATNAPVWSQSLSKQILDSLPKGRLTMEDQVLTQLDSSVAEATKITDEAFNKFLRENKGLIEAKIRELGTSEKLTQQSLKEVEDALDKQLEADMKERSKELSQTLRTINERIARLKAGTKLNPVEALERRALMLARRLQIEGKDPSLVGKKLENEEPDLKVEKPRTQPVSREETRKTEEKKEEPKKDDSKKSSENKAEIKNDDGKNPQDKKGEDKK